MRFTAQTTARQPPIACPLPARYPPFGRPLLARWSFNMVRQTRLALIICCEAATIIF